MRVALYLRVSSDDQTIENQKRELMAVVRAREWTLTKQHVFTDEGISGAKGRDKRPGYNALLLAATRREFELIATWSVDRLGRSVLHLAQLMNDLRELGVGLFFHKQGIDTTTSSGRAMMGMCAVFAELERDLNRERTVAGLNRARAQGKRLGRPSQLTAENIQAIKDFYKPNVRGHGIHATAKLLGFSVGQVQRTVQ